MNRGETKVFYLRYSPIKLGIRRSKDGKWERKGQPLPLIWATTHTVTKRKGFSVKLGEYILSVYWWGFEDWKTL